MASRRFLSTRSTLVALGYVGVIAVMAVTNAPVRAQDDPPDVIYLTGIVRDFKEKTAQGGHPDFENKPSNGFGRYSGNIATTIGEDQLGVLVVHADVDDLPVAVAVRNEARDDHVQFLAGIHAHGAATLASVQHPLLPAAGQHGRLV